MKTSIYQIELYISDRFIDKQITKNVEFNLADIAFLISKYKEKSYVAITEMYFTGFGNLSVKYKKGYPVYFESMEFKTDFLNVADSGLLYDKVFEELYSKYIK